MHQHHVTGNNFSWLIPILLISVLLIFYMGSIYWLKQINRNWSPWKTISFVSGIIFLGIALLPSIMQWAHQDIQGHMVQHLLIGMLAPLGLVFGAPITLVLKIAPVKVARSLTALLGSSFFHFIAHPVTAFFLNIGGMYVLYLSPLYNATFKYPALHHFIHIHFLLVGYLFTWSIAGPDPAPRRPGFQLRLTVLFFSIATHAFLSKFMYAFLFPLNSPHTATQIRNAAKLMYYGGDLAELILAVALFFVWYHRPKASKLNPAFSYL